MKTGRLLKFHRPGGEVHAYIYREGSTCRASVFAMGAGSSSQPVITLEERSEEAVEQAVKEWVEMRYPKSS